MKSLFLSFLLSILLFQQAAIAQPEPTLSDPSEPNSTPTFSSNGIWHKNMELVGRSKSRPSNAGEHFQVISINDKQYVVSPTVRGTSDPAAVELWDVTNPRDVKLAVRISGFSKRWTNEVSPSSRSLVTEALGFWSGDVWKDRSTSQTLSNHVFGVFTAWRFFLDGNNAEHQGPFQTIREDGSTQRTNDEEDGIGRFMVFDFTEALALVGTGTDKHIIIDDAAIRNSAHLSLGTTASHKIYVGYIKVPNPDYCPVHTVGMEKRQGIFQVSSNSVHGLALKS